MLRLSSDITIGNVEFNFITEVMIDESWDKLSKTATIIFPRKLVFDGQPIATGQDINPELFKRGDPVTIRLGYNESNKEVFFGYVRKIHTTLPIRIECEDEMFLMKQTIINTSFSSISLEDLLFEITDNVNIFSPIITAPMELGKFRITRSTPAQALEFLRSKYHIQSFFRERQLYVGLAYVPELRVDKEFDFRKNIIQNNLEYVRADDLRIRIEGISIDKNNQKIKATAGDPDGDIRTFNYYNLTQTTLQERIDAALEKVKYEGYRGNFTTFGEPILRQNDAVVFTDDKLPDNNGTYLIKGVERRFGQAGYRQVIYPDVRIE